MKRSLVTTKAFLSMACLPQAKVRKKRERTRLAKEQNVAVRGHGGRSKHESEHSTSPRAIGPVQVAFRVDPAHTVRLRRLSPTAKSRESGSYLTAPCTAYSVPCRETGKLPSNNISSILMQGRARTVPHGLFSQPTHLRMKRRLFATAGTDAIAPLLLARRNQG